MAEEKLNPGWSRCPEYLGAINLALNSVAGGLKIHDMLYYEETDSFYVELTDTKHVSGNYYDMGFRLDGSFVRSCFKAVQGGTIVWASL